MTHYDLTSDKDAHHQCAYAKMDCSRNFATRIHRYSLTAAQHPKLFSVNSDARTTLEIYGHVAHREAVEKVASVLPALGLVFAPASARNLFHYPQYSLFVRPTTAV